MAAEGECHAGLLSTPTTCEKSMLWVSAEALKLLRGSPAEKPGVGLSNLNRPNLCRECSTSSCKATHVEVPGVLKRRHDFVAE